MTDHIYLAAIILPTAINKTYFKLNYHNLPQRNRMFSRLDSHYTRFSTAIQTINQNKIIKNGGMLTAKLEQYINVCMSTPKTAKLCKRSH